jgi:hypothetical protein
MSHFVICNVHLLVILKNLKKLKSGPNKLRKSENRREMARDNSFM